MRGIIVGFGTIAQGHLKAYRSTEDIEIVSIVDTNDERRSSAGELYGFASSSNNVAHYLEDPSIDFVDICAPPYAHKDFVIESLHFGKHVICEKPFLLSRDEYTEVLREAAHTTSVVYPCHNYKFAPVLRRMEDVISAAEFGVPVGGHFRTLRHGHARGVPEWLPDWRRSPEISGGGIIQDHGPHSIYMALQLYKETPKAVSCIAGEMADKKWGSEDTALITLLFDNERELRIDLTWAAQTRATSYALQGSKQSVSVSNDTITHITPQGITASLLPSDFDDPLHSSWFVEVLGDFKAAIAEGRPLRSLLLEAFTTTAIIEAAYASATSGGRPVPIDVEAISKFGSLGES